MKRFLLFLSLLPLVLGVSGRSWADTIRIPLKDFLAVDVITLRGAADDTEDREFSIPLSERWQVRSAVLRFAYRCSSALLREASHLTVLVNDYPAAQLQLEPQSPSGRAEVAIAPRLLKAGYNPLLFSVAQHVTRDECEDPSLPELWTRLDLTDAELELDVAPQAVPAKLSSIGRFLFDPRDLMENAVQITIPEMTPAYLRRAALAAAGAALRREYRPVSFTVSDRLASGRDHLVIGPPAFLEKLGLEVPLPGDGAALAVTPLPLPQSDNPDQPPVDPYHAAVMITGSSDADLDRAAKAFSLLSTPFPPLPAVPVGEISEPPLTPYSLRSGIAGGEAYTFAALGFRTTTFKGTHPRPRGFSFRLPSDLHIEPNRPLVLSLNLAYGSGMRRDSSVNIEVNGRFMAAVPLDNPNGSAYQDYRVHVLSSALRRGVNKIRFVPVLTPPIDQKCAPIQAGNLVLTLFEDSALSVPVFDHWIRMPSLEAFMIDGFPFGKWADLRESTVCLPTASAAEATAAVNMVALAAQKIGYPPTGLKWEVGAAAEADRDLIWVGTRDALAAAPLGSRAGGLFPVGGDSPVPEPQLRRPAGLADPFRDWLGPLKKWLGLPPPRLPLGTRNDLATADLGTAAGAGWGYVTQTRRPGKNQRTVLALTAEGDDDLISVAHLAWRPEVQGAAAGATVAVRTDTEQPTVYVIDEGEPYYLGRVGTFPVVGNFINTRPLTALTLLLVLLGLCSGLIFGLLRRIRKRRLPDA